MLAFLVSGSPLLFLLLLLVVLADPDGRQLDGERVEERVVRAHRLLKVRVFCSASSGERVGEE